MVFNVNYFSMKNFIMCFLLFCFGLLFAYPTQASPPKAEKFKVEASVFQTVSCVEFCEFSLPSNEIFQDFKMAQWKQNADFLSQNPANYKGKNYIKTPILAGKSFSKNKTIFHTLTRWLFGDSKVILCGK